MRYIGIFLLVEISFFILVMGLFFIAWLFSLETSCSNLEFLHKIYISGSMGSLIAYKAHIAIFVISVIFGVFSFFDENLKF
jgi:hypothetical protein